MKKEGKMRSRLDDYQEQAIGEEQPKREAGFVSSRLIKEQAR
jgi:hypothetical protein